MQTRVAGKVVLVTGATRNHGRASAPVLRSQPTDQWWKKLPRFHDRSCASAACVISDPFSSLAWI